MERQTWKQRCSPTSFVPSVSEGADSIRALDRCVVSAEVGQMSESAKNSTSTKLVESERKLAAHDTLNHKQINSMRRHKKGETISVARPVDFIHSSSENKRR